MASTSTCGYGPGESARSNATARASREPAATNSLDEERVTCSSCVAASVVLTPCRSDAEQPSSGVMAASIGSNLRSATMAFLLAGSVRAFAVRAAQRCVAGDGGRRQRGQDVRGVEGRLEARHVREEPARQLGRIAEEDRRSGPTELAEGVVRVLLDLHRRDLRRGRLGLCLG